MDKIHDLGIRDRLGERLFRDIELPKDSNATYAMEMKLDVWNSMHQETVARLMKQQAEIHGKTFLDDHAKILIENIAEGKCHAFLCVRTDNETGEERGEALVTCMDDVTPWGPVLFLEDIIVDADMRRRGIGRACFHQLVVFADVMQRSGVLLRSKRDNIGAHEFFNSFGAFGPVVSLVSADPKKALVPDLMKVSIPQDEISFPQDVEFISGENRGLVSGVTNLFQSTLGLDDNMLVPEIAMDMTRNVSISGQSIKLKDLARQAVRFSSINSSFFPKKIGLAVVDSSGDVKGAAIMGPNFGTIDFTRNSVVNVFAVQNGNGSGNGRNPVMDSLLDAMRYVHRYVMRNSGDIYLDYSSLRSPCWSKTLGSLERSGCHPVESGESTMITGLLIGDNYKKAAEDAAKHYRMGPARGGVVRLFSCDENCQRAQM